MDHCPHRIVKLLKIHFRFLVTCPSVCLFHHLTAAAVSGGFAAERRAGRRSMNSGSNDAAVGRSAANASSRGVVLKTSGGRLKRDLDKDLQLHRILILRFIK